MQAALDAGVAAAARQDLEALSVAARHGARMDRLPTAPHRRCRCASSLQQLAATQSEVKLQSGGPGVAEWERQLDMHAPRCWRSRRRPSDCLDKIEKRAR